MSEKEDEILTELTVDQIRYIVNKLAAQEIGTFQVGQKFDQRSNFMNTVKTVIKGLMNVNNE